jgi:hypothetical protein
MKTFKNIVVVKQPVERVWRMVRDRLPEFVSLVDDIESVTVIERDTSEKGKVRLLNRWKSRQTVPVFLRARLGAEAIGWLDRNEWIDATMSCHWDISPLILRDCITCGGRTLYEPAMAGRGTRVTIDGTFNLTPGALRGVAGPLEQPVTSFVESIATTLIPKNFRKVLEAAAKFVETGYPTTKL